MSERITLLTLIKILTALEDPHLVGEGILSFLSTLDAKQLRIVAKILLGSVRMFPWNDSNTRIKGDLQLWRRCFPRAIAGNISNRRNLTDAVFAHLAGIYTLDMSWCNQAGITDAAFAHLAGIHTLNMSYCYQEGITNAAFAHLCGIHTLIMRNCYQIGITDAVFAHLAGIHTLDMSYCHQVGITDAALTHLTGIHTFHLNLVTLRISGCNQATVTWVRWSILSYR